MSGRSDKRKRKCTPRRARERERERESYLLNCAELKASDTRRNNAINLMHDVIYLMPRTFTDGDGNENACVAGPNKDKRS